MKKSKLAVVVLAAGKGTRMQSPFAKVLQPLNKIPLLNYILEPLDIINPDLWIVVVGYQSDKVKEVFSGRGLIFVDQKEQLGTGHAALQTKLALRDFSGDVLIVCGDMPFIKPQTLIDLVNMHQERAASCTILTLKTSEKIDFGRIIRDNSGLVTNIVEHNDVSEDEKKIDEFNSGVYCFNKAILFKALSYLGNNNVQKEYYLTDTLEYIVGHGFPIETVQVNDAIQLLGINSQKDLKKAEQILTERTGIS